MYENIRVFFSILWMIGLGVSFATGLAFVISWGGYTEYLYASLGLLAFSTVGVIVTSL